MVSPTDGPSPQQLTLFDPRPSPAHALAQSPANDAGRGGGMVSGGGTRAQPAGEPLRGTVRFEHPRAQRSVTLGEHSVAYAFRRARRRSIGFVIGADGLSVAAPRWVSIAEVEQALRDKAGWIVRKLHEQFERSQRLQAARLVWRDGIVLPYLGQTLVIALDPGISGVRLQEAARGDAQAGAAAPDDAPPRLLRVGLPTTAGEAQIREAVQGWLQRQARRVFEERCALYAQRLGVRMRRLSLSSAATRWGSASADGSVRLNWRLIHFAPPVIDYVVTHELAHLREMNHSPAFWNVVRSVLPDFERSRSALKSELLPAFD